MRAVRALLLLAACMALPTATMARDRDIQATAVKNGKVVTIDVDMVVNAPLEDVWAVMTDWDNMAKFIPGISTSDVLKREGNRYRVRQSGRVPFGPFSIKYEAVRDIEIVMPHASMRFEGVSGDFERMDGTVKLAREGDMTRVAYRAESVPTVWVPPFVGTAMVEHTTRSQFGEMRVEMLRRASARAASKSSPPVPRQEP